MKATDRAIRIGGMAFDRLYANIMFFSSLPFIYAEDSAQAQFDGITSSLVFVVLTFLAAFLWSSSHTMSFTEKRRLLLVSAALAAAGSFTSIPTLPVAVPAVVSGAMVGAGSSMLLIGWLGVFSRETITGAIIEVGLAFAFAFAASLGLSAIGTQVLNVAMIACPFVSCAALFKLCAQKSEVEVAQNCSTQGKHLEYRNLVYIFFLGFIMGVMRNYSASHVVGGQSLVLDMALSALGLIVCIAVVVIARLADVSAARFLYRISFVFVLMSAVILATGRENIAAATLFAFVGTQCFTCCLIARAMLATWALGGSSLRKCIANFGTLYAGEFVGVASALLLANAWHIPVMTCAMVLAACLVVGYTFFFTEADFILISRKIDPRLAQMDAEKATLEESIESPCIAHNNPKANGKQQTAFNAREAAPSAGYCEQAHGLTKQSNTNDEVSAAAIPSEASPKTVAGINADHHERSIDEICEQVSAEYGLTPRESEILPSVARGRTLARIQEELFISASTVNTHIRHIYAKLGVNSRQELLDFVDDKRMA